MSLVFERENFRQHRQSNLESIKNSLRSGTSIVEIEIYREIENLDSFFNIRYEQKIQLQRIGKSSWYEKLLENV